jgi:hypothetical protein
MKPYSQIIDSGKTTCLGQDDEAKNDSFATFDPEVVITDHPN